MRIHLFHTALLLSQIASTNAFTNTPQQTIHHHPTSNPRILSTYTIVTNHHHLPPPTTADPKTTITTKKTTKLHSLPLSASITSSLRSGPFAIPTLTLIAFSINLPLTLYRQAYSFSVGYGSSVFLMAAACALSFPTLSIAPLSFLDPPFLLTTSAMFYGLRLALFLWGRERTVPSKAASIRAMDTTPRFKRPFLSINVSLFYALMTGPLVYTLRGAMSTIASETTTTTVGKAVARKATMDVAAAAATATATGGIGTKLTMIGAILACFGALLEAIADHQKWVVLRNRTSDATPFSGPTGGVYSLVRHPNYLGEVLFWTGLFVSGVPSFGGNAVAWIGSSLGLFGIWKIMTAATKRLEGIQKERYGGQKMYEDWCLGTKYPLVPFKV